ncbi:MAG: GIY-YIG nuclease family protein [Chlamydiia bacterium]|nr:GIY-YIG nuclease family protein [Chlamydiia bacterium]
MTDLPWTVYIIEAENGKLYTGITTDLARRLRDHQSGPKGARFFHFAAPKAVVYEERCVNRSDASRRERELKSLSRQEKLELIASTPTA